MKQSSKWNLEQFSPTLNESNIFPLYKFRYFQYGPQIVDLSLTRPELPRQKVQLDQIKSNISIPQSPLNKPLNVVQCER